MISLSGHSHRILALPPTVRDAKATVNILSPAGVTCFICKSISHLISEIERGAGALLLTDHCFDLDNIKALLRTIDAQPDWSDIPIIALMYGKGDTLVDAGILKSLRNVTLLDRPVAARVLISAAEVAIRSRTRQYEIRDLIARERAALREAENAIRAKDDFLAVVSHELRTPLNGILGWAQILKRRAPTPQALGEGLDAIERSGRAQAQLIDDILDLSRITSGKVQLDLQDLSVFPVIQAAIEMIQPDAAAKNIVIEENMDFPTGLVQGDPVRLQQVIWNLLRNAVKFTPANGRIRLDTRRVDDTLEITVSDTGIGIEPDFLPYVFDRFRQADSSSTRSYGGLGLGLAIAKQIVELHRGSVGASSPGKNLGATFKVTLPVSRSAHKTIDLPSPHGVNGHAERPRPNLSGLRILIVDDDRDAIIILRNMLEDCQANVTAALSAAEALESIKSEVPDVLVSDIGMPAMDGFELIRIVRRSNMELPAIAVTAFARPEDQQRALEAGFNAYAKKPLEPSELLDAIERIAPTNSRRFAGANPGVF